MFYYKLTLAYDGTNYCGYQVQPNVTTVQELLMKAVVDLFGPSATITAASRTDSGVHARGQVVLLKTEKAIRSEKIPMALNVRLPDDIVVVACNTIDEQFHPRYVEHSKTYEYLIYNGPYHFPQDIRYSIHYQKELDVEMMQKGADILVGTHDFESYSSAGKSVEDTVRTVTAISVKKTNQMISIKVTGNGFLYNMVRIIVGTLMELGIGKRDLESIELSIKERNRQLTGTTAPAKGLTLQHIDYLKETQHA